MKSVITRRSTHRRNVFLGLVAAVTMLATACGDSSDTDTAIEDTAIEDTAIEDTAIEDTAIEDTGPDVILEITIADGTISGVDRRVEVGLGSIVKVTITSDVDAEVHLHGYDEFLTLTAGQAAVMVFEANIPGVFEAELEGRGQRITEFEVS